jgi:hypothetical protein
MWTGLTIDDTSVKQGCVQVLSTRIFLQAPLHAMLPSTMFVAVPLFGNAVLTGQVATREPRAYMIGYLRLSRIVWIRRADGSDVSAFEEACTYSLCEFFDGPFYELKVLC